VVSIHRNGVSVNLVCPTGAIAEVVDRAINVKERTRKRLPVVEGVQTGKIFLDGRRESPSLRKKWV
jgi:hypothetical protein